MIKIKGHSEFFIEYKFINNKHLILKSSNKENANRLAKQMKKQKNMYDNNFLTNCLIPKIYKKEESENKVIYYMKFIKNSLNLIDFLSKENTIKVDWLYNNIIKLINSYLAKCKYKKINSSILINKLQSVRKNIESNSICISKKFEIEKYLKYLETNREKILDTNIPVGICHGDLTFSNILIDTNSMNLYLIDFLDSFIESPLFDIIKIRQDTCFNWTVNMYNFSTDKNKILLTFKYIDIKIDNYFNKYDWYLKTYKYFQILNILRIIQYCKNIRIRDVLISYLKSFKL